MTRKLYPILLFFAHLTILPGCQSFPYFGNSTNDSPHPPHDRVKSQPPEVDHAISTANAREEPKPARTNLPEGPPREAEPKKKPDGITGIVTLEPDAGKPVIVQSPGPLPQLIADKTDFEPIVLALQRMLEGRHQDAIKHLSAYDGDKQELFLRLLPILSTLVKKRIEDLSTQEVAVLNKQIDGLRDQFRPRSELVVSRMCYCKEVRGYGSYVPLPDSHAFLAGTKDRIGEQVQLYVELKNFASEPTKDGEFLTKLSCSLELRDAKEVVWSKRFDGGETTLRRSSRLNDFYSRYGFYVPALSPGTYQLTINIADETNPKNVRIASKSIEFRVTPVANPTPLR